MDKSQIEQVRSFNRAVTRRIGVLEQDYMSRGRPYGEARILFEAGLRDGVEVQTLRQMFKLDSGYLSRILRALEKEGLALLARNPEDGRRRELRLTPRGHQEFEGYDAASAELASALLERLAPMERSRLVAAMAEVERLLEAASIETAVEPADTADARACLGAYYDELAQRFEAGFDPEAVKNFDPAEMAPPKGWFVVARIDCKAVGCGALKVLEPGIGEIKRVWTSPDARGKGVARQIMDRLEQIAAEQGMRAVRLDTNRTLTEAQAFYLKRGYAEIAPYNDNVYADRWFEKGLG